MIRLNLSVKLGVWAHFSTEDLQVDPEFQGSRGSRSFRTPGRKARVPSLHPHPHAAGRAGCWVYLRSSARASLSSSWGNRQLPKARNFSQARGRLGATRTRGRERSPLCSRRAPAVCAPGPDLGGSVSARFSPVTRASRAAPRAAAGTGTKGRIPGPRSP